MPIHGIQRVNLATFTTKEHQDFPVANHYYIDNITFAIFLTGKLHAHLWQISKAFFQLRQS
jgi:hypothetical protein